MDTEKHKKNYTYNAQRGCVKTQWESYRLAEVESEGPSPFALANQTLSASVSLSSEPAIHRSSSGPYPTQRTRY